MHYYITLSALIASLAAVSAQTPDFNPFITPKANQDIRAGTNFDILWEHAGADKDATVSIRLLQGTSPKTLQPGPIVASHIPSTAGRFSWAVPTSIKDSEVYGLIMTLDGKEETFQYSFPFDIDNSDDDDRPHQGDGKPLKFPPTPGSKFDDDDDNDDDDYDDFKNGPPKNMAPTPGPDQYPADKGPADKGPADQYPADKGPAKDKPQFPADEPVPDIKYNNGTIKVSPPKPKPSAAIPPPSKPSAPAVKPKPNTVINGASPVAVNGFTLFGAVALFLAL